MFDWFFNLFRKKEEESPIKVDLNVHDLAKGCILDYNLESWEVLAAYTYKYKGYSSKEYKIRSSSETRFLNVSDSNSLVLGMSKEVNINNVDAQLRSSVAQGQPLVRLNWNNETYTLKESAQGQFSDDQIGDWASFSSWEYVNAANTKFVYVSKWEDNSIECFAGDYLKEHEISNILAST
ncbi:DUF4178 domain-containing protein [Aureispira anguillae]|uniref:DUF4178 domain-containing protein n=1 Tax=Aureispira anguillae TaxID=2864201 RepID=A0A915YHP6_9BACT|nr:DUF4178 domain-containing protein [Aureispira anguillae]BDS13204.1 DUF4178 domain-containing protein [Aureispira anguillae]